MILHFGGLGRGETQGLVTGGQDNIHRLSQVLGDLSDAVELSEGVGDADLQLPPGNTF